MNRLEDSSRGGHTQVAGSGAFSKTGGRRGGCVLDVTGKIVVVGCGHASRIRFENSDKRA